MDNIDELLGSAFAGRAEMEDEMLNEDTAEIPLMLEESELRG